MSFPYLKHPVVISSLILTFLNDHYLKYQYSNFVTGKISDFTGIFYFPLFIYALAVFFKARQAHPAKISKMGLLMSILITDILFVFFKYTALRIWLTDFFNNYIFKIQIVPDITDLSALSMNLFTYWFASQYFKKTN